MRDLSHWTLISFLKSTIGKKYLMGITGLVWAGFVLTHMLGNLLIFVSADAYNSYGHALTSGKLIYIVETVLIVSVLLHVSLAINLTLGNIKARPSRYAAASKSSKAVSVASRTMAIQGSLILVFIISHIATFKYGKFYETTVENVAMRDLHRLVLEIFSQPGYVAWYVVALVMLGFHLRHGFGSIFQSFGLLNERYEPTIKKLSWTYAILVAVGFISQPLYVCLVAGQ